MTKFTHNDLSIGQRIAVRGIEGDCILVAILDGHRGLKVCPMDGGSNEASWVDVSDVTGRIRNYVHSGLFFPSFCEAGAYLAGKGWEPNGDGYQREIGRYRYLASMVFKGDAKGVFLSFAEPEFIA